MYISERWLTKCRISVIDKSQMASLDIEQSLFDLNNRIEAMKREADQFDLMFSRIQKLIMLLEIVKESRWING